MISHTINASHGTSSLRSGITSSCMWSTLKYPDRISGPPTPLIHGYWEYFPRGYGGGGVKISSISLHAFRAWRRIKYSEYFTCKWSNLLLPRIFGLRDHNHSSTPEILLLCFNLLGTISCEGHIARQCATNACWRSARLTNCVWQQCLGLKQRNRLKTNFTRVSF
jgi:hypothetical protein